MQSGAPSPDLSVMTAACYPAPICRDLSSVDCERGPFSKRSHQADVDELASQLNSMNLEHDSFAQMSEWARSSDPYLRFEGTRSLRMLLSVAGEIPIQDVISSGVVPALTEALSENNDLNLKFEAAWAITNIASGTPQQTEMVVKAGAIPKLVGLLACERDDVREQGMWGLGNIAGDRAAFRDMILAIDGALSLFVQACMSSGKVSTIRTGVWSISNLCRGKPRPQLALVRGAMAYLSNILWKCTDPDTLSDACWAFDGLSDTGEGISAIIASGVVPRLVQLLCHDEILVSRPALRVIGQIASGTSDQTQTIIDHGVMGPLLSLLRAVRKSVRRDACWTLSNIAAGPPSQVQVLLDHGAIPQLRDVFFLDIDVEVKKEAAWAICNACTSHKPHQLEYILDANCIQLVCDMLEMDDFKVLEVVLDALNNILEFGRARLTALNLSENPCVTQMRNIDGVRKLYNLHLDITRDHNTPEHYSIWKKSGKLIEDYFRNEM